MDGESINVYKIGMEIRKMMEPGAMRSAQGAIVIVIFLLLPMFPVACAAPMWVDYGEITAKIEKVEHESYEYENQTHTRSYYTIKILYFHEFTRNFKGDQVSRGDVVETHVMGPNSKLDCEEGDFIKAKLVNFTDEWQSHWDLEDVEETANPYYRVTLDSAGVIILMFIPFYYYRTRKRKSVSMRDSEVE